MIVLDTHAWWWAISEPARLSALAAKTIENTPSGQICVASILLWEFVMMVSRRRIHLKISPREWFNHAIHEI
jgi:PIN domain nuclease of toxin-antitoxin system